MKKTLMALGIVALCSGSVFAEPSENFVPSVPPQAEIQKPAQQPPAVNNNQFSVVDRKDTQNIQKPKRDDKLKPNKIGKDEFRPTKKQPNFDKKPRPAMYGGRPYNPNMHNHRAGYPDFRTPHRTGYYGRPQPRCGYHGYGYGPRPNMHRYGAYHHPSYHRGYHCPPSNMRYVSRHSAYGHRAPRR